MGLSDFSISFDPGSLATLARLQGMSALLDPAITAALTQAGQLLVGAAQAKTWEVFAHPTGQLAGSIYFYVISPTEVAIAAGVPYAARREYGFTGMTDSLGRTYRYDPGKPYMQPTVDQHQGEVETIMATAVSAALGRVAV